MIEGIRLATQEEIELIKDAADLTPTSTVLAFDKNLAVLRVAHEVDPVFFDPQAPPHKRALMLWGIENMLRFNGVPAYYFNVQETDTEWREQVEHYGAKPTSKAPEIRYKKILLP